MSTGGEICFTMSVVDERALVRDRVSRIRAAYPAAHVVVIVDAPPARHVPEWDLSEVDEVRYAGRHLYGVASGGLVVQAHLEAFLGTAARWWLKVDPDTVVRRPFASLPEEVCFFGTLQDGRPGPSLQGGCIGGTRDAARSLAGSRVLLSRSLADFERTWAHGNPLLLARARRGFVSFDFVHAWACRSVGIPLEEHPEIRSEWKQPPRSPELYAVTHPHKLLDEAAERRLEAERLAIADRIVDLVRQTVPAGATAAVVSKGDDALLAGAAQLARHFPADDSGGYAGYHPADSEHAIALLEADVRAGVDHLVIPDTALWWLDHYAGLARHLDDRYHLVAREDGAGAIWSLRQAGS